MATCRQLDRTSTVKLRTGFRTFSGLYKNTSHTFGASFAKKFLVRAIKRLILGFTIYVAVAGVINNLGYGHIILYTVYSNICKDFFLIRDFHVLVTSYYSTPVNYKRLLMQTIARRTNNNE